jgi:hypothetical protein
MTALDPRAGDAAAPRGFGALSERHSRILTLPGGSSRSRWC